MNLSDRTKEVKALKQEMKSLLTLLKISKSLFFRTVPRITGRAYKYYTVPKHLARYHHHNKSGGRKMSLRQQVSFLRDLVKLNEEMKEDFEKAKNETENKTVDFVK